jgi:hypothetical protein
MMFFKRTAALIICSVLFTLNFLLSSCNYRFNDVAVDPNIKTAKIATIENVAQYVNPQLTPNLTDRLRQKVNNQTKLSLTNSDNANIIIEGKITDYIVTTSGATQVDGKSQASINRLSVTVKMNVTNHVDEKQSKEFSVTRQFDFKANLSLQTAEAGLLDEMVKNLTDEIFNQLFSNW